MIIFEESSRYPQAEQGSVATIGKFDGVHLGHQLILDQLKEVAKRLNLPSLVILIEPHPEEFFAKESKNCPARLSTLKEKCELLESFGIDFAYLLKFNQETSELSADSYIKDILVDGLGVAAFVIGNDFRFGHKRAGNFKLLQSKGIEFGFEVIQTASYERNGYRISSTFVREQLANGDFDLVEQLLGRPYSMTGEVEKGRQLGADLGFPTCNVNPARRRIPLHGVFACEVRVGDRYHKAAVNIGYRPTITEEGAAQLEAHILDFDENLYGKTIEVIFRQKIRGELKFDGIDALKKQLNKDVRLVREIFG